MPPDEQILSIVREVSSATTMLTAMSRRIDDMAGALRDLAAEKSGAHTALHKRIDGLEERIEEHDQRWARVYGLAAGVGIGSGLGTSLIVQLLT